MNRSASLSPTSHNKRPFIQIKRPGAIPAFVFVYFFALVDWPFYRGFSRKTGCRSWCFDGEVVVECVVIVVP